MAYRTRVEKKFGGSPDLGNHERVDGLDRIISRRTSTHASPSTSNSTPPRRSVSGLHQLLIQLVPVQQVTKVQQRGGAGDLLDGEPQTQELAHRLRAVDRVIHALVRKRAPRLHHVNQRHHLQRLRLPAPMAGVGERHDQPDSPRPRNRGMHRLQELPTARHPPTSPRLDIGEPELLTGHDHFSQEQSRAPGKMPLTRTRKSGLPLAGDGVMSVDTCRLTRARNDPSACQGAIGPSSK